MAAGGWSRSDQLLHPAHPHAAIAANFVLVRPAREAARATLPGLRLRRPRQNQERSISSLSSPYEPSKKDLLEERSPVLPTSIYPMLPDGCGGAANCAVTHGRATDARNTGRGIKPTEIGCAVRRCVPVLKESRADHSGFSLQREVRHGATKVDCIAGCLRTEPPFFVARRRVKLDRCQLGSRRRAVSSPRALNDKNRLGNREIVWPAISGSIQERHYELFAGASLR